MLSVIIYVATDKGRVTNNAGDTGVLSNGADERLAGAQLNKPSVPDVSTNKGRINNEVNDPKGAGGKEPFGPDPTAHGTGGLPTGLAQTVVGAPPAPTATAPSLAKEPASSPVAAKTNTKGEFQPLFNGKDLTGWVTYPGRPGHWRVENGILTGSGADWSSLWTVRSDYRDFHLRVEARINEVGNSGVYLRCPFGPSLPSADDPKWPDGYEVTINNSRVVRNITGGLYPGVGNALFVTKPTTVPFGQWFTLEVIADGSALAVLVDGKSSAYKFAQERLHSSGHIALQQYSPETVIEFRRIEIKELNRPDQKDPKEIERFPGGTDRVARVAFTPDGSGILSGTFDWAHTRLKGGGDYFHFDHNYVLRLRAAEASGRNLFTRQGAGAIVRALGLSSDGQYAASSTDRPLWQDPLLIWDLKAGKRVHAFVIKDKSKIFVCAALSFSPDGRRVVAASTNGAVLSWIWLQNRSNP